MKRHIKKVHEGLKDFNCKSCKKSFTPDSVRGHIKNIHKGHKYFNCDPCEKLLTSASNLREHI